MILSILVFFVVLHYTQAAALTTGDLLKYYPIKPQEYAALSKLITQRPAISERRIVEAGHRSLADWSRSLPSGWNDIFNFGRRFREELGSEFSGYPLCILKANDTMRRRNRSDDRNDFIHAGVAPTTGYTESSYPKFDYEKTGHESLLCDPPNSEPDLHSARPHQPCQVIPPSSNGVDKKNGDPNGLVSCVVVVRRIQQPPTSTSTTTTTTTATTRKPDISRPRPGYPHTFPPAMPLFKFPPPPFDYPQYAIPSPPVPSITTDNLIPVDASRNVDATANPEMDPASNAVFHQMLSAYYQQLARLYMAQGTTDASRGISGTGVFRLSVPSVQFSLDDEDEERNYDDENDDDDNDDDDDVDDNNNDRDVAVYVEYDDDSQEDDNEIVNEDVDR